MRYIRKFKLNYNIGDYIVITNPNNGEESTVKIVGFTDLKKYSYKILMENGEWYYLTRDYYDRYATPEEIKKFDLSIQTKKYNL